MSEHKEVAGGQASARHFGGIMQKVGVAVAGILACLSVFASGYLMGVGSGGASAKAEPQPAASLPASPLKQQRLKDRPEEPPPSRAKPATRKVTVEAGQSLWGIAATYAPGKNPQNVVTRIIRLNSLADPNSIEVGQKLVVPKYRGRAPLAEPIKTQPAQASDASVAIPTRLVVPAIGLKKGLVNLDVVGGALQVPQRWSDVGWWHTGPRPGERGAAVFVGHVDSPTGPAVFYGLSSLRVGDLVRVERADSTAATFKIFDSVLYSRTDFPSDRVYRDDGPPLLHLITCGGTYDRDTGQYSENLVVSARLVTKAKK